MKCKRAKQEMALFAGRDLDPATEQELRRHLASCPGCQNQWNRIRSTTSILHQVSIEEAEVSAPQLWSSVSRSIQAFPDRRSARAESFSLSRGVVPLVAMASLVLAVVSINRSLNNPPSGQTTLIPMESPFSEAGSARTVDQPIYQFDRGHLIEDETSSVVQPPQSAIERMRQDRGNSAVAPAPQSRRFNTLPGGVYLQED